MQETAINILNLSNDTQNQIEHELNNEHQWTLSQLNDNNIMSEEDSDVIIIGDNFKDHKPINYNDDNGDLAMNNEYAQNTKSASELVNKKENEQYLKWVTDQLQNIENSINNAKIAAAPQRTHSDSNGGGGGENIDNNTSLMLTYEPSITTAASTFNSYGNAARDSFAWNAINRSTPYTAPFVSNGGEGGGGGNEISPPIITSQVITEADSEDIDVDDEQQPNTERLNQVAHIPTNIANISNIERIKTASKPTDK